MFHLNLYKETFFKNMFLNSCEQNFINTEHIFENIFLNSWKQNFINTEHIYQSFMCESML